MCVVPPLYKNNCGVTGGCQDCLLVQPRAVETAGLDREEERTLLSEKAPPSGRWRGKANRETGSGAGEQQV